MEEEKTDISNIQELLKLLFHNIRGNILTEEYINDVSKIKSFNIVDCKVSSTKEENIDLNYIYRLNF